MLYLSFHAKLIYSLFLHLPWQALLYLGALCLFGYAISSCTRHRPFERLAKAIDDGDDRLVNSLLCEDAIDLDRRDGDGLTPLLRAAHCGHYNILLALLKAGSKINDSDRHMRTVLMVASSRGHYNIVDLLLRRGARISAKDENGNTALILATQRGLIDVVKLLIENCSDINWKNMNGLSSLNAGG